MVKLIYILLIFSGLSFANETEENVQKEAAPEVGDAYKGAVKSMDTEVEKKNRETALENVNNFMPGSLGVGIGESYGSDHLRFGTSFDIHGWYFPFKFIGFGAFYDYTFWKAYQGSNIGIDGRVYGLEFLGRIVFDPHTYVGVILGQAEYFRTSNTISFQSGRKLLVGLIAGISYDVNDAFSIAPSVRILRATYGNPIDTVTGKIELQYRFVLY